MNMIFSKCSKYHNIPTAYTSREQVTEESSRYQKCLDPAHTLDSFDEERVAAVMPYSFEELSPYRLHNEHSTVFINGPMMSGKSHLAHAIGNAAEQEGYDVVLTSLSQAQAAIGNDLVDPCGPYLDTEILILDNFEPTRLSRMDLTGILTIIKLRKEIGATIIISSYDLSDLCDSPNFVWKSMAYALDKIVDVDVVLQEWAL